MLPSENEEHIITVDGFLLLLLLLLFVCKSYQIIGFLYLRSVKLVE